MSEQDSVEKNFRLSLLLGTFFLAVCWVGFFFQSQKQGMNRPVLLVLILFNSALLAYWKREVWARYVLLGFSSLFVFAVPYTWIIRPDWLLINGEDRTGLLVGYGILCLSFMASLMVSRNAVQPKSEDSEVPQPEEVGRREGQKIVRCASCGNTFPEFLLRCPICGKHVGK